MGFRSLDSLCCVGFKYYKSLDNTSSHVAWLLPDVNCDCDCDSARSSCLTSHRQTDMPRLLQDMACCDKLPDLGEKYYHISRHVLQLVTLSRKLVYVFAFLDARTGSVIYQIMFAIL